MEFTAASTAKQQSGVGIGIVGDGKGWSGATCSVSGGGHEANLPRQIKERRPKVFMEVTLNKRPLGRVVIELFGDVVPKTAENFRCLCTGERGVSAVSGKTLHFKGTRFHRIIPGRIVQGGDISRGDGSGGDSIYSQDGDGTFPSENFKMKHDRPGLVSMAHRGGEEGKNCSQFFFTSRAEPKFDNKHVVVGRVIQGISIVSKVESIGTRTGKPQFEAVIADCGEIDSSASSKRKAEVEEPLPDGWERCESRSKPGLMYYKHTDGLTQFERPGVKPNAGLLDLFDSATKRQRTDVVQKKADDRACEKGKEVRVYHILKKHRSFFGKPASSWRQREITWSKKEAVDKLEDIRLKLANISYGGGREALQRKFGNLALLESDDEVSAKIGGDLGPIPRKKRLFGGRQLAEAAWKLKVGEISEVVETEEGVHVLARFE